ncbi:MAG: hypothetical protein OZ935_13645 [Pseudomonadota bacterium]|nr:hypothetical protein [Pseudomonadota bacterium]
MPAIAVFEVMRNTSDPSRRYAGLAAQRVSSAPDGYRQPEHFGYDFRDWVSPYTKGANTRGGIALVLQDWASEDGLKGGPDERIAELGRNPGIRTNKVLEALLNRILGLSLSEVYATNAFPFVKRGGMSSPIPQKTVYATARRFLLPELEIAEPRVIIALGSVARRTLESAGITCIHVPHPAARIGGLVAHEQAWRSALAGKVPIS